MDFQTLEVLVRGETYLASELSARQRQELFKLYKEDKDPVEVQAYTVKMGYEEFKDLPIDELIDFPGSALATLSDGVLIVSGLADNADKEAEKNS